MATRVAVTENELVEELRRSGITDAPPDAMTTSELAQAANLGLTAIKHRLHRLRAEGRLQIWRVARMDASGRRQIVNAYTITPLPKKKGAKHGSL